MLNFWSLGGSFGGGGFLARSRPQHFFHVDVFSFRGCGVSARCFRRSLCWLLGGCCLGLLRFQGSSGGQVRGLLVVEQLRAFHHRVSDLRREQANRAQCVVVAGDHVIHFGGIAIRI